MKKLTRGTIIWSRIGEWSVAGLLVGGGAVALHTLDYWMLAVGFACLIVYVMDSALKRSRADRERERSERSSPFSQ